MRSLISNCWLSYSLLSVMFFLSITETSLASRNEAEILPKNIEAVLNHRNLEPSSLSVMMIDLESDEVILSWNPDTKRTPASVMKLFTTASALDILGPSYKWSTEFYVFGEIKNKILDGDLLIKGKGDPFLTTENVWKMLRRIKQKGIDEIKGDLLIDDSFFNHPNHDPAKFDNEPLRSYNVGPNALLFNFKSVRFFIDSNKINRSVTITEDPKLDNVEIVNELELIDSDCTGYQRGIRIITSKKYDKLIFRGSFPTECEDFSLFRSVLSHDQFNFGLFKSTWRDLGGKFDGEWKNTIHDTESLPFYSHDSVMLSSAVKSINKNSNNVMSRNLLLTIAAESEDLPATEEKGRARVNEWLLQNNFDAQSFFLDNGSGLSREASVTVRQVTDLLKYVYRSDFMPEFISSLSINGLDGTMSDRFENDEISGKFHIKTGSLDHVSSLAGYMNYEGKRYAFAIIQNAEDVHKGFGEEVQEALMRWLYSYGNKTILEN